MTKRELQNRVDVCKQVLEKDSISLNEFRGRLSDFISDLKSYSVIFGMIEKLPAWRELVK